MAIQLRSEYDPLHVRFISVYLAVRRWIAIYFNVFVSETYQNPLGYGPMKLTTESISRPGAFLRANKGLAVRLMNPPATTHADASSYGDARTHGEALANGETMHRQTLSRRWLLNRQCRMRNRRRFASLFSD